MAIADSLTYLAPLIDDWRTHWPKNRTHHLVCHGHSVPAGYFATPLVDTFNAYPHLLHAGLKARFPYAVLNVIVTAIGGENAISGAERFASDVLALRPSVVTIDYGLNDRRAGLPAAEAAWRQMIESALAQEIKVILLTPTLDATQEFAYADPGQPLLGQHAEQIRRLAAEYNVGLADATAAWETYLIDGQLADLLSWSNHPNRRGHELVAEQLLRWFPAHALPA